MRARRTLLLRVNWSTVALIIALAVLIGLLAVGADASSCDQLSCFR
jgi:hypothetical protein